MAVKLPMMDAHRIKLRVCVCVCGPTEEVFYGGIVGWYIKSVNCRLSLSAACGSEFMMIITI